MSRDSLLHTIRSAVDSLRVALQELEEALAGPSASSSGPSSSGPGSAPVSASSSAGLPGSLVPSLGHPLPGDALFLVSSLHIRDRPCVLGSRRAWFGRQPRGVCQGHVAAEPCFGDSCVPPGVSSRCLRPLPFLSGRNHLKVERSCKARASSRAAGSEASAYKVNTGRREVSSARVVGIGSEGP